jgi:A/G-specific adenine glycosylase
MRWYTASRRDLPWRRTRDPYAIWISEIMLQQTRVETVEGYYRRFLTAFPTVRSLAAAPLDKVLKAWEGLGYYTRARNLHRAAGMIVSRHGGKLPSTVEGLLELPGVGQYTAAAVASIAFGRDAVVLDGNVIRVLCRLFGISRDPRRAATQKQLLSLAESLLPRGRAGDFNQAMMELGATVCTPRPSCDDCCIRACCTALRSGRQEKLPRKAPKKRLPHCDIAVGVVRKGGRILIDRRRNEGLLGGLWELPGGKRMAGETLEETVVREIREETGVRVKVIRPLATVRHAYSHFKITMHAFECRWISGRARPVECTACEWVKPQDLDRFAFPRANNKILDILRAPADT